MFDYKKIISKYTTGETGDKTTYLIATIFLLCLYYMWSMDIHGFIIPIIMLICVYAYIFVIGKDQARLNANATAIFTALMIAWVLNIAGIIHDFNGGLVVAIVSMVISYIASLEAIRMNEGKKRL
jgi:hypothetical protein